MVRGNQRQRWAGVGAVLAPPFSDVTERIKGEASTAPTMPDTDLRDGFLSCGLEGTT